MHPVMKLWLKFSTVPGGKWLFSRIMGWKIPYTGSVYPMVLELEAGRARVRIKDRRAVRNHLDSIHAIAQLNLAEYTTGLAMTALLPSNARGIITALQIGYFKKGRGPLTAECICPTFDPSVDQELVLESQVTDEKGDLVSLTKATWKVGPKPA